MPTRPIIPSGYADKYEIGISDKTIAITSGTPTAAILEAVRLAPRHANFKLQDSNSVKNIVATNFKNQLWDTMISNSSLHPNTQDRGRAIGIDDTDDAPAIAVLQKILAIAFDRGASDVHLQPNSNGFGCSIRTNGVMTSVLEETKIEFETVVARIKVLSKLNTLETRIPQDGSFEFKFGNDEYDLRISTLPSRYGERVVMRIHSKKREGTTSMCGSTNDAPIDKLVSAIDLPKGLVIICGPTGSGKTTTAFSVLESSRFQNRNIIAIENPIEYLSQSTNINQVEIDTEDEQSIGRVLRAVVRQDPDILLFGEIRDRQTASAAVTCSLSGRLVLATMHAGSPGECFNRIKSLGADVDLFEACLSVVISQRLVRVLCATCSQMEPISKHLRKLLLARQIRPADFVSFAAGCEECGATGYTSREALFDIQLFGGASSNPRMNLPTHEAANQNLERAGLEMVARCRTDISEINRVFGPLENLECEA